MNTRLLELTIGLLGLVLSTLGLLRADPDLEVIGLLMAATGFGMLLASRADPPARAPERREHSTRSP